MYFLIRLCPLVAIRPSACVQINSAFKSYILKMK